MAGEMATLQAMHSETSTNEDTHSLVERARGGCEAAYSEIARRYFPRLVQLVLPRLRSRAHMDAEDIAQESLARAFRNIDSFDPQFRFTTWLYTIALRIAMDHNRGQRRRLSLLETHRSLLELDSSNGVTTHSVMEARESADAIWQLARRRLSEVQYTAMWLRFAEDLSVAEVASVMRKTQVGVRVLLHRSRLRLLKELNKEGASNSLESSKDRES